MKDLSRGWTAALLCALLFAAGWLRFTGLNWDEDQHLHPDERFLTMVTSAIEWPHYLCAYFDTSASPLNPRNRGFGEEVFKRLPESLQEFLVRTSILQHMDVAACNAVTGVQDTLSILEDLETQNLFLASLDSQKRWYRYHYLFREFLLNRLQREHAGLAHQLHCQAGLHYEERGDLETARAHYLAAQEYESAARLLSVFR